MKYQKMMIIHHLLIKKEVIIIENYNYQEEKRELSIRKYYFYCLVLDLEIDIRDYFDLIDEIDNILLNWANLLSETDKEIMKFHLGLDQYPNSDLTYIAYKLNISKGQVKHHLLLLTNKLKALLKKNKGEKNY